MSLRPGHYDLGSISSRGPGESDAMSVVSTTGDHSDFRATSDVAASAASTADGCGSTVKMEMDINMKTAVWGISLNKYMVAYDSSELQRLAFEKAFSPPKGLTLDSSFESADIQPAAQHDMKMQAGDGSLIEGSFRTPRRLGSSESGRELGDTECVVSVNGGRSGGRMSPAGQSDAGVMPVNENDWPEGHTVAKGLKTREGGREGEAKGRYVGRIDAGRRDERAPDSARGRSREESSSLPDLQANVTRLQEEMVEKRRKLEQRKMHRRRLEREEETKVRMEMETIYMVQAAIQKVMREFDTLDDDFDRRASSRASSQSSVWMGTRHRLDDDESTHAPLLDDGWEQAGASRGRDLDREKFREQGRAAKLTGGVEDELEDVKEKGMSRSFLSSQVDKSDAQFLPVDQNRQPGNLAGSPKEKRQKTEEQRKLSIEEELRITRQMVADKLKDDLQNWPRTPKEEEELERRAEEKRRKDARRARDRQLGGFQERSSPKREETRVADSGKSERRLEMEQDIHAENCNRRPLLMSEIGLGDQTCTPESRQYWKREREKKEKRESGRMQEREQAASSLAKKWDEPRCVYITYEAEDQQGRKCFIGQTVGSKRSGKGVLTWLDGSKYSGEWSNDQPNGFGVEKYQNGSFYAGSFKNDARHGFGEFAVGPQLSYSGLWEAGQMHGVVYITELKPDGQSKLIPARAERGEVHRRPNDPLSSIMSAKKNVEVAVAFAKDASTEARDLAWSMSVNATQIAKNVIASRSPSPLIGLETPGKSLIPPIAGCNISRTVSIAEDDTGWETPAISSKRNEAAGAKFGDAGGAKDKQKSRPVSAGGASFMGGGAGLPPLHTTSSQTKLPGFRPRPVTTHTTRFSEDSETLSSSPPSVKRPTSAHLSNRQQVVEAKGGLRVRLAEDGLASVTASPAPSLWDMRQTSLYSTLPANRTEQDTDGIVQNTAETVPDDLELTRSDCEEEEVRNGNSEDVDGFSDENLEAAIAMLLADTFNEPEANVAVFDCNTGSTCATPTDLVALLIGEYAGVGEDAFSKLHEQVTAAEELGVKDSAPFPIGLPAQGYMRWSSPVQLDADQYPPLDETVLQSNYELVRSARPHITGNVTPTESPNISTFAAPHRLFTRMASPEVSQLPKPPHNISRQDNYISDFPLTSLSARAGSPFPASAFPKPTPPARTFGLSPRSMRLRPLPRSVGSHAPPTNLHEFSPSPYLVQGVRFGNGAADARSSSVSHDATTDGLVLNARLFPEQKIVRQTAPVTTTTTVTSTTTTTTTTVLSSGERSTVRSVNVAQETAVPGNDDRMLVAVVTLAAAEVVASLIDDVGKNIEALGHAEFLVKSTTGTEHDKKVPKPSFKDKKTPTQSDGKFARTKEGSRNAESTDVADVVGEVANDTTKGLSAETLPVQRDEDKVCSTNECSSNESGVQTDEQKKNAAECINTSELQSSPGKQDKLPPRNASPVRFQGFDELDREVSVMADDDDDNENMGELFEATLKILEAHQEAAQSPGGTRSRKGPTSPSIDGFLATEGLSKQSLASPAELAWRLINKFSTGFGLSFDELQAFSRTFVEKPRLKCFVGFMNVMDDDHWLQVQNRFVEEAAKTHGVDVDAQTFVREEAFSWVLERHSRNPVNKDCMMRCGFAAPLQTLVSASYEVTSGIGRGGRAPPSLGTGSYDIVALRLLILHSFVETCWRSWQEMIAKASLQLGGDCARTCKGKYDDDWQNHATWGYGNLKTPPTPRSNMPWSQPETSLQPSARHIGSGKQYVSPLAKRVRPGSSKAAFGRPASGGNPRPLSGQQQRPFSARTAAAEEYGKLFPPNQRQRLEAHAQARTAENVHAALCGYDALGYIRDELSRSAFANVAEAFAWFDLDRRQFVSLAEVDVGLKNLRIFGVDVATVFALCSDVQLRYGTRELEIGEFQFARLFQWNDQLTSNGKGMMLYGESYREASDRAKQHQKRIIEKIKAHMQLRHTLRPTPALHTSNEASPPPNPHHESGRDGERAPKSGDAARPGSASKLCPFCKRSHENDFHPSAVAPSAIPPSSLSPPPGSSWQVQQVWHDASRPRTHSPIPMHRHNYAIRHAHLPTGKFDSPLSSQGAGRDKKRKEDSMRTAVPIDELSAGWDYESLAKHLDAVYQDFSPHAILGVMVTAVLDQDLCRRIMWSHGRDSQVPRHIMPRADPGRRPLPTQPGAADMLQSPTSQIRQSLNTTPSRDTVHPGNRVRGEGNAFGALAARPPRWDKIIRM